MVLAVLAFLLTLILVVGLHEAGHALAAWLCGVGIERISIGFGKPLICWKDRRGIEWVWAIWPLGGYVRLLNTRIHPVDPSDYSRCFDKKSASIRCFILISGVLTNVLVAWFALTLFFMLGFQQREPVVLAPAPQSLVAKAGLKAQDRIVAVDGQATPSWQEVGRSLITHFGQKEVTLSVIGSDHQTRNLSLDLSGHVVTRGRALFSWLGIEPDRSVETIQVINGVSLGVAIQQATQQWVSLLVFLLIVVKKVVTGVIPFALLLGPIGFISLSIHSLTQGLSVFLFYIANLSLAVGLVNVLPIPGLDGASIVYTLIEKIRGKPMSVAFEVLLYQLAMILFYVLLVQLALNDLLRFAQR
jgi:regulator of sigma E protease